ncbi:MAG TPA: LLM class F420-dependent oxidoreductase [Acidimicrobiales bacterium]|nr:LLM class F420-dependent oxidoreductase [Acidimicrobiales bacterium]
MAPKGSIEDPPSPGTRVRPLPLGITTPVLTMLPAAHASWESAGTIDDVVAIAEAADRLGYHHLTCSEHVVVPVDVATVRGSRYWDPLATFGYLAARTSRIRLATNVLVLGYHHPLAIAKRYGTLDQVSGGRVILGLGVGSLKEEFELLDAPFDDRGPRADDAIAALRASLSNRLPEYDGPYYRFSGVVLDPTAVQPSVPLWIGGRTARSLRRAVALGDGWVPFGIRSVDLGAMIAAARATPAWAARAHPLEVVLQNGRPVDPLADPAGARLMVDRLMEAGATALQLRFVHHSLSHYLEQLEAMAALAGVAEVPG